MLGERPNSLDLLAFVSSALKYNPSVHSCPKTNEYVYVGNMGTHVCAFICVPTCADGISVVKDCYTFSHYLVTVLNTL